MGAMRVLVVFHGWLPQADRPISGGALRAWHHGEALKAAGHEVLYTTRDQDALDGGPPVFQSPAALRTYAKAVKPDVVFYPNNRRSLPDFELLGEDARAIGAPMLVTNRIGESWIHHCKGGCVIYSASGEMLAKSNREGREEVLIYDLEV